MTAITPFQPTSLEQAGELATRLSKSGLLPSVLRGKPDDVLVILITGHELGLSPMQAIRGLNVIQGKAVMSAELMVALVANRSDVCEYIRPTESSPLKAVYETRRKGHPQPTVMAYSIDDAKAAGLTGKDNWKNHPAAMLRARAASALVRAVYPDLMLGVYEQDEAAQAFGAARRDEVLDQVIDVQSVSLALPASPPAGPEVTQDTTPPREELDGRQLKLDLVRSLISVATTTEKLGELIPSIKELPEPDKTTAQKAYADRKRVLLAAKELGGEVAP